MQILAPKILLDSLKEKIELFWDFTHTDGGVQYVQTPDSKKKKKESGKVINLLDNMYSVHTNQIYRTVCYVPPGMFVFIVKLYSAK
jgi:hypothetical protein